MKILLGAPKSEEKPTNKLIHPVMINGILIDTIEIDDKLSNGTFTISE